MGIVKAILIGIIGVGVGVVTYVPNIMMSDSGTRVAQCTACTGILASISFVIGGIIGAIYQSWFGLLPGLLLQLIMFAIPTVCSKLHQEQLLARSKFYDNNNNNNQPKDDQQNS